MAADWDLRKLQLQLDKKNPQPIYFLYGEETFLIDEALKALKLKVLTPGAEDFNYDSFMAPETSAGHVRDAIETLPMMSDRRLVIYKNVDSLKDSDWDELLPVIDNPIDSTTVVFVANQIDKRKKIIKRLQTSGAFVELKKPYDNQIPMWIEYIAYLNDVGISREAISALQELVGTHLSDINNEVKKIKNSLTSSQSSAGQRVQIELKDVLNVVSRSRIENIFSLTDAIGRRDRAQALICLANLLEHGQNAVAIVSLIYRQIRIISAIHEGQKEGLGTARMSQKIGVPEFFMKQYVEQARLWDRAMIVSAIKALHDTDRALKSSPISAHIWLENFILQLVPHTFAYRQRVNLST